MTKRRKMTSAEIRDWHRAFAGSSLMMASFDIGPTRVERAAAGGRVQLTGPAISVGISIVARDELPWWVVATTTKSRGRWSLMIFGVTLGERFTIPQAMAFLERLVAAEGTVVADVLLTPAALRAAADDRYRSRGASADPVQAARESAARDQAIRYAFRQLLRRQGKRP